ncbi:MAG TPA: hypothetical protein PKC35_03415 [Leptospiraceae bacterium]|nr:hypothetical protein [Leptospiraceae bacterium]
MREFPVAVGHRLSEAEELLLRYWLESYAEGRWRSDSQMPSSPPADLSTLRFLPRADIRSVEEILSWFLPVVVFAGKASDPMPFISAGAVAVISLDDRNPLILPPAELPPRSSVAFVISDDPMFRLRMRQILRFAGREPRMDFSATEDIAQVLTHIQEWPEIIVVDLDSSRVDVVEFIYRTEKILRERPAMRTRNQMMIVKDFAKPGLDPVKLRPVLSPHAKRIFHPLEAMLAILESMVFYSGEVEPLVDEHPRSLREMLYGDDFAPPGRLSESFLAGLKSRGTALSRSSQFILFAQHLKDRLIETGSGSLAMK